MKVKLHSRLSGKISL